MSMKKAILNDKMYNLISKEEFFSKKDYYNSISSVAIEEEMIVDGERVTVGLPITQSKNVTGAYSEEDSPLIFFTNKDENYDKYICQDSNVIDFSNIDNMSQYYENYIKYNDAEREIITNTINQSKPVIKEDDSPLLKITKQTICDKNIDMDKYADRFEQYNNDKRLVSSSKKDITMKKASMMLDKLDVDTYVITTNKEGDIPNPMPGPLIRKVSGEGEELTVDELIKLLKGEEE